VLALLHFTHLASSRLRHCLCSAHQPYGVFRVTSAPLANNKRKSVLGDYIVSLDWGSATKKGSERVNDIARRPAPAPSRAAAHANDEDLPSLFGRLGTDLSTMVDLRLNLLKVEIKEEVDTYVRGGVTIVIGALVTAIGFALANVALGFFVSNLFASAQLSQPTKYGLGFIMVAVIYLVIGSIIVVVTRNRLAAQGLVPKRSVEEFEHDKELVKSVI
jgi:uncharacterized membrane protein YqjE